MKAATGQRSRRNKVGGLFAGMKGCEHGVVMGECDECSGVKAARFAGFLNVDSYRQYLALVSERDAYRAALEEIHRRTGREAKLGGGRAMSSLWTLANKALVFSASTAPLEK